MKFFIHRLVVVTCGLIISYATIANADKESGLIRFVPDISLTSDAIAPANYQPPMPRQVSLDYTGQLLANLSGTLHRLMTPKPIHQQDTNLINRRTEQALVIPHTALLTDSTRQLTLPNIIASDHQQLFQPLSTRHLVLPNSQTARWLRFYIGNAIHNRSICCLPWTIA